MSKVLESLSLAARSLRRAPLFTATVILSLALGIGVNSAVYSLLSTVLLRPFPSVREPNRIVAVFSQVGTNTAYLPISYLNYEDIIEMSHVFSGLAAYQKINMGWAGHGEAQQVAGEMVSGNFFQLLGLRPEQGRLILPEDDRSVGESPITVLSYSFWRDQLGADPNIVGRTLLLNNRPFTVIGVAPLGFKGMSSLKLVDFWVPLSTYKSVYTFPDLFEKRSGQTLLLLGRLNPRVDLKRVDSELRTIAARLESEYPVDNKGQSLVAFPLIQVGVNPSLRAIYSRAGLILMIIVAVLLLIACLNIANMLLIRALTRTKETAIRLSLGASRVHLSNQLLVESMLLTMLGGGLSLVAACWTRDLLWKFRPPSFDQGVLQPTLDGRTLLFTLTLSAITGLFFGFVPLLQSKKQDMARALREHDLTRIGRRGALSSFFVALEVAFCALCLGSAGIFLENFYHAQKTDPGFDSKRVLMASADFSFAGYREPTARQLERRILERVRTLPGVESADFGENRLLGGFRLWRKVTLEGKIQDDNDLLVGSSIVGNSYFETVGIPLVRGRDFNKNDQSNAPQVVIINEALAHQISPSGDALGKYFRLDDEDRTVEVVGIVRNSKYRTLGEDPSPFLYLPADQRYTGRITLHVRVAGSPGRLLVAIRKELQALDPMLPWTGIQTASEVISESLWIPKISSLLLSVFGVISLILAAVGVYGVTAHSVSRQSHEIGIRMVLGAKRSWILFFILRRGMSLLLLGLVVGLFSEIFISRWMSNLLYGETNSGFVFSCVAFVLTVVALAANFIPAYSAAQFDPASVLRNR
jgi:predicted permease